MTRPEVGAAPSGDADTGRKIDLPQNLTAQAGAFISGTRAGTLGFTTTPPAQIDFTTQTATPTAPGSGVGRLFVKSSANRPLPAVEDQYGNDQRMQPSWGHNGLMLWLPTFGVSTMTAYGTPAVSAAGTAGNYTKTAGSMLGLTPRISAATSATAGTLAELRSNIVILSGGTGAATGGGGFYLTALFAPSNAAAVSGERFFIGLSLNGTYGAATNVEPSSLVNTVGIAQLSTDATQFYAVGGGTTAQTATALGTGVGAPTSTTNLYQLVIYSPPASTAVYYVQLINLSTNTTSAVVTYSGGGATSPAASVIMGFKAWKTNNATALAAKFDLGKVYFETDQ